MIQQIVILRLCNIYIYIYIYILFKQSNGLIRAVRNLLRRKQQLRDGMLTLNGVLQTQMILSAQVA